jgi:hypothetical protein
MKRVVLILLFLVPSLAFAAIIAETPNDPEAMFLSIYRTYLKAEKFEMSGSTTAAVYNYREADRLLTLLREKHSDRKRLIVEHRAQLVSRAIKRLAPNSER